MNQDTTRIDSKVEAIYFAALKENNKALRNMPYEGMPKEYTRIRIDVYKVGFFFKDSCLLFMP